jgi:hypothetical protein
VPPPPPEELVITSFHTLFFREITMSAVKTYRGNCHCGANRYEVNLPEVTTAISCPCSLCVKKGYLWAYPAVGALGIIRGSDSETLTTYSSAELTHEVWKPALYP